MAVAAGPVGGYAVEQTCNNKYDLARVAIYSSSPTTTMDYDPNNASGFYFNEIGDPLVVPTLTIDSVQLIDPVTGNPVPYNQAVWGQTVKVRVNATNGGAATGAVASLIISYPGSGTFLDSHAQTPTLDPVVTSWTGSHSFEWLWTVPMDAPIGQYTASVSFRDQYYLLGWGKSDFASAFAVQGNDLDLKYAKLAGDNTFDTYRSSFVTASYPDYFYIEKADRDVGIRVEKIAHGVAVGTKVDVTGMMNNSLTTGERCIRGSLYKAGGNRLSSCSGGVGRQPGRRGERPSGRGLEMAVLAESGHAAVSAYVGSRPRAQ